MDTQLVEALTLATASGSLVLEIEPGGSHWCRCYLEKDGRVELGGQPARYVLNHLVASLEQSVHQHIGELQGHQVSWVMTLAAPHCTLYRAIDTGEEILFFVQDAGTTMIGGLSLTPAQRVRWQQQLNAAIPLVNSDAIGVNGSAEDTT